MAKVKLVLKGAEELERKLKAYEEAVLKEVDAVRIKFANRIAGTARKLIQGSPKTGQKYGGHQASAPGEAPATNTGNLVRNIVVDVTAGSQTEVYVLSKAPYSEFLEEGTLNMDPRPFFQPAIDLNKKKFRESLARAINSATRKVK